MRGVNLSDAVNQADILDQQNAELVAVQTEGGVNPSGTYATVALRLEGSNVGSASASGVDQTAITTLVDVTGAAVAFTAAAGRLYVATLQLGSIYQATTAGVVNVTITNAAGTQLTGGKVLFTSLGITTANRTPVTVLTMPVAVTPGAATIKGRIEALSGGALTVENSFCPAWIRVEVVG